ncbi:MAG: flavodoxin-dependent (E)-4-hydroxy-3-methylbut-2-enyl-diphosphate synthase [Eubacteriales bacterium]|nr:flavodoxin-dependent (E)-4-hydroxy-3-methylbut-2-enyl-diphosphate synthase [Eubacteriales bacterium]MDD3198948.1 flavodoxin-dependent (E)-4-hydroxy-3-methylbut-2-enyl-diphosphate synthase [Eubacteriales bacterium]MDD4121472.1 flavodoxin-dependent (E)-4-hydroxy-3-methylbut-2-enyl-diphosphate synthase [Eubacteriales bacterium]MDD4629566.1 flavodoxin-dependent (E)-4-hydroxy-3-methylbut-2-enyl-diphosphate synthase [Eubacteriales bacterium]
MSRKVNCGGVLIGGGAPITIQSMTNTDTRNIADTVLQIERLKEAGCDIVRCAIPDMEAAEAFGAIKKKVKVPLVADIHFDYRLAVAAIKNGADKVRINPGNIGSCERVKAVIDAAKERQIPIRIGVNSGSLEKEILEKYMGISAEALVESALKNIKMIEDMDFSDIVVSLKSSDVRLNYQAHNLIYRQMDYPLHIGITEAGTVESGKAKSAVGIGSLLLQRIGDTIRVSLTGDPVNEVYFACEILKALNLKHSSINFISCPTCGRCGVDLAKITAEVENALRPIEEKMRNNLMPSFTVAVMGCEVNGPGEAREADFGVACGKGKGLIFKNGKIVRTVKEEEIAKELIQYIKQEKVLI